MSEEPQPHPFLDPSFHVAWSSLEPAAIEADITLAMSKAQQNVDAIASQDSEAATYESTILALEDAVEELYRAWGYADHLSSVCEGPEIRKAYNAMLPKVTEFSTRIYLNEKLWQVIKTVAEKPEIKQMPPVHQRLVEDTLRSFKDHGADLHNDRREEFEKLSTELSQLTQKYSENVLDSTNAWELIVDDEAELTGIPESAKEAMKEDAAAKGHGDEASPKWRITLHMPSYLPVMQYCSNEALRRKVWEASSKIGHTEGHDNTPLIGKILKLRQRKAELLDRKDFAELTLAQRMVKNGKAALEFIETLHDKVEAPFREEMAELRVFKSGQTGSAPDELMEPWDTTYWAEKRRQAEFSFDEEELRPYFPIHHVIDGLFALTERLFGVSIVKRSTFYRDPKTGEEKHADEPGDLDPIEVWHPDVRFYDLLDEDETHLGSFYADWFPRESKRAGAWMNALRTGGPTKKGFRPHLGLMAGNMTKPTGNKPALMTHREVETIFHEFGHLLHHLLGKVEIRSLNGTNVAWDFVELPSQIMENWCWEREALDLFARHYANDETIPDDLFAKMLAARNYMQGNATMRQLSFGKLDLDLHINHANDAADRDLDALIDEILDGYSAQYATKPPSIVRRFGHLFSGPTGYACGYYSYKWAEVLEADCFTRFKEEGVLNRETGRAFRDCILSKGDSEPPEKLFRDFMGRDPDSDALLRRAGLLQEV
ncbi:M3 family metallopeptidase [Cerasicoccus fimbriatus]|uniref:M3 family metallopeptidase n=1 Tax=Cerasicoccus fimbriatus TaxID=3014554 RepID=UPI0022B579AD|nr:M3 family metallopeptidase [Cerasicoccus sp. TK19100]